MRWDIVWRVCTIKVSTYGQVWSDMRVNSCNRTQRSTTQGTTQHHLTPRCKPITANHSQSEPITAKVPVSDAEGCLSRLYFLERSSVASPPIHPTHPLKHPTTPPLPINHTRTKTVLYILTQRRQLSAILLVSLVSLVQTDAVLTIT